MRTNLMGSPGDEMNREECKGIVLCKCAIAGDNFLKPLRFRIADGNGVMCVRFLMPGMENSAGLLWNPHCDAEVGFVDSVFPNEPVNLPEGRGCLGSNDNAAGVSV